MAETGSGNGEGIAAGVTVSVLVVAIVGVSIVCYKKRRVLRKKLPCFHSEAENLRENDKIQDSFDGVTGESQATINEDNGQYSHSPGFVAAGSSKDQEYSANKQGEDNTGSDYYNVPDNPRSRAASNQPKKREVTQRQDSNISSDYINMLEHPFPTVDQLQKGDSDQKKDGDYYVMPGHDSSQHRKRYSNAEEDDNISNDDYIIPANSESPGAEGHHSNGVTSSNSNNDYYNVEDKSQEYVTIISEESDYVVPDHNDPRENSIYYNTPEMSGGRPYANV